MQPASPTSILVVEDELLIRYHLCEVFEEAGWHVLEAGSGDEALDIMDKTTVTAVVTDIEMPGSINGLGLSWHIYERWPNLPVIISSARVLPRKPELPSNAWFLAKPVPPRVLIELVTDLVKKP